MPYTTHKRPPHPSAARSNKTASVRRPRQAARPTPKIIGERFATAALSGDKKKVDRILREIAEIFPPSDSPGEFLEMMSELLARTAHQALKLHVVQEELRNLALTDELTGLHNRRGFFALAEQHLKFARRNREQALLFFADINSLKQINDRFGHSEGDAAIKRMALVLKRSFRDSDIVARLGGTNSPFWRHGSEAGPREDLEALRVQHRADLDEHLSPPPWMDGMPGLDLAAIGSYVLWLMDRDSKCPGLKSLQGKIWQEGYRNGELHGEVYPDVPLALDRWSRQGKIICIYSSGSVLAQKLLFSSTAAGDLTRFLRAYFDTTIGPKHSPESYSRIAESLALAPSNILFISDVTKELDAARTEGMQTALCVRTPPNERVASTHCAIHSFDELFNE